MKMAPTPWVKRRDDPMPTRIEQGGEARLDQLCRSPAHAKNRVILLQPPEPTATRVVSHPLSQSKPSRSNSQSRWLPLVNHLRSDYGQHCRIQAHAPDAGGLLRASCVQCLNAGVSPASDGLTSGVCGVRAEPEPYRHLQLRREAREPWRALETHALATAFQTYRWQEAWCANRGYGTRRAARHRRGHRRRWANR